MATLDDAALVAAAQRGDRNALDQLLRRHYDRIHAVCRRIAGGTRDADDACQEALIKITRSLPRFDGRSAFGTWAYRIATNAALDELRRRDRRPSLHALDDSERPEAIDPTGGARIEQISDRLLLDQALGALSDDLRAALVLRDVADLDYGEIANTLDVPLGTVKSRIARARAALADELRLATIETDVATVDDATAWADLDDRGNQPRADERPTDEP
jgi:RNA polymerase sigma-70 factor (ECF subfamily)